MENFNKELTFIFENLMNILELKYKIYEIKKALQVFYSTQDTVEVRTINLENEPTENIQERTKTRQKKKKVERSNIKKILILSLYIYSNLSKTQSLWVTVIRQADLKLVWEKKSKYWKKKKKTNEGFSIQYQNTI